MKMHHNPVLMLVAFLSLGSMGAAAREPLTLRQAVDRALGQSPEGAMARAGSDEARAGAALARTLLLPQISFTEDISRGNDPVYAFGTRLRQRRFTAADFDLNSLNRPSPIGDFASRLSGSWMAFDSLRTQHEIRRADLFKQSAASAARAADQQIVMRVVESYQAALYAEREVDVAQHEQQTAAALLASVDDHVKAGLAVESDRMSALVNVAARRQELIAAQGDLELAWAQLREAIGAPDLQPSTLKPIEPHAFPDRPLELDVATALKTRPDLTSLGQARSAQTQATAAARAAFGPHVAAYGNWEEDRNSPGASGGNNWVAGVQIGIDILPFTHRAALARETAAQQRLSAQHAAAEARIRLEVSQAQIHRRTAALSIETARAATEQAQESLRILKNRYSAGLANLTDLLRAEDAGRQSQTNYWHAVYGNVMAYAELLFATGTLTPDAAEELQ